MKKPFPVELRRTEFYGGLVWLSFFLCLMGRTVEAGLGLLGIHGGLLLENEVYFVGSFVITAAVFWRFLAASLSQVSARPLEILKGLVLGYVIYEVLQVGLSVVYGVFVPELSVPNDSTIRAIAGEHYAAVAVSVVLLSPITEETLVRGLVFGSLRKKNRAAAYVLTGLLFGLMHTAAYLPEMDGVTFLLNLLLYGLPSVALCAAYEFGGTIWTPIFLHMILNALSMYALGQGL